MSRVRIKEDFCKFYKSHKSISVKKFIHPKSTGQTDDDKVSFPSAPPPNSIEHGFGFLGIKIPSANRRFLESNNGVRKSHADLGHISQPGNQLIIPILLEEWVSLPLRVVELGLVAESCRELLCCTIINYR